MKWLVGLLIVCSSLFSNVIAVASDGDNINSNISSKASRCNYYMGTSKNHYSSGLDLPITIF